MDEIIMKLETTCDRCERYYNRIIKRKDEEIEHLTELLRTQEEIIARIKRGKRGRGSFWNFW